MKVFLYHTYSTLYSSVYLYSMYNLGGWETKIKVTSLQQCITLAVFKIPDRNVCCLYGMVVYTNQSTHHSPTTPDKNKKPGEGEGLSPDKVGGMYLCTFFTVTILLVVLLALGILIK